MVRKIKSCAVIAAAFTFFTAFSGTGVAVSFPFRSISPGDPLPAVTLTHYKTRERTSFEALKGQPFVVLFWGADVPTKKRRSIKAFKQIKKLSPFLEKRKISVLSVNVQGDAVDVIDAVLGEAGVALPVYLDQDQQAYGDLGIFVMPSVLLVDKLGNVVTGTGYSKDFIDRLRGEVEILQGEKKRAQVERELRPEMVEKTKEEKAAGRHLNMGRTMLKRGMHDSAIREFEAVLKLNPKAAEAHLTLGCLYLDKGQIAKAEAALDKGLELTPEKPHGLICQARIKAHRGKVDEALEDLEGLMLRQARNPELRYALGSLYEKQGRIERAAAEYRKAYELLNKKASME